MNGDAQAIIDSMLSVLVNPDVDLNSRRSDLTEALYRLSDYEKDRAGLAKRINKRVQIENLLVRGQLHDGPLQNLSAAVQMFQLQVRGASVEPSFLASVQNLILVIKGEIDSIRTILCADAPMMSLGTLAAVAIEPDDLIELLRHVVRNRPEKTDIELVVDETAATLRLVDPEKVKVIVGFVRETMTNARRHGGATKLMVDVRRCRDRLTIQTHDNGSGFADNEPTTAEDFQNLADNGHLGLRMLSHLASSVGGELVISGKRSRLGGAVVEFSLEL